MRKTLKIVSISAGIISAVSAFVLCCIYLEDFGKKIKKLTNMLANRLNEKEYMEEEYPVGEYTCEQPENVN